MVRRNQYWNNLQEQDEMVQLEALAHYTRLNTLSMENNWCTKQDRVPSLLIVLIIGLKTPWGEVMLLDTVHTGTEARH